jgi:galactokinase
LSLWRVAHGSTTGPPDVHAFLETLQRMGHHRQTEVSRFLPPERELVVTRAPGRLDVMGGIADYSGSLVLQLPLREATRVALQKDSERRLRLVSLGGEASGRSASFDIALDELLGDDYPAAAARFRHEPARRWAAYAAGAFLVLSRERHVVFPTGARLLVDSDVPEGRGVSSSAALEVAVMQAVAAAFDVALAPRDMALLCQKVENEVAGAPCGVMDQMTAACGEEGRLLSLLCQPAELRESVPLPEGLALWGVDSGVSHAVSGSDYTAVRTGAFMGYRMIADEAGLRAERGADGRIRVFDPRWNGYLANLTVAELSGFAERLPLRMAGGEFLRRYGGTTDSVTRVDATREYAVRVPTAHPVEEHARVREFARGLSDPGRGPELGALMYASHESYSRCGLGASGTDRLVALVREADAGAGLYGAKITGGGSGGTVAILGRTDSGPAVAEVARRYSEETGREARVFSGSSAGAARFGHLLLERAS